MKLPLIYLPLLCTLVFTPAFAHNGFDEMTGGEAPATNTFSLFKLFNISPNGHYTTAPKKQVVGFYSKGSITSASEFPLEGTGFVKLHRPRKRWYTSYDMVEIVKEAATEVFKIYPQGERLQIGDCSLQKGGYASGHASHQNGLDADFSFYRVDHLEQDPEDTTGFPDTFVTNGKVLANFDTERNWDAFKQLVKSKRVLRIFMDEAIKKHLCAHAKSLGEEKTEEETLRRFRPYPNHDDHFHLRITCPANSPGCVPQDEVPEGSGCP